MLVPTRLLSLVSEGGRGHLGVGLGQRRVTVGKVRQIEMISVICKIIVNIGDKECYY